MKLKEILLSGLALSGVAKSSDPKVFNSNFALTRYLPDPILNTNTQLSDIPNEFFKKLSFTSQDDGSGSVGHRNLRYDGFQENILISQDDGSGSKDHRNLRGSSSINSNSKTHYYTIKHNGKYSAPFKIFECKRVSYSTESSNELNSTALDSTISNLTASDSPVSNSTVSNSTIQNNDSRVECKERNNDGAIAGVAIGGFFGACILYGMANKEPARPHDNGRVFAVNYDHDPEQAPAQSIPVIQQTQTIPVTQQAIAIPFLETTPFTPVVASTQFAPVIQQAQVTPVVALTQVTHVEAQERFTPVANVVHPTIVIGRPFSV